MNERSSFPDRPRDETERSFLEGRDYNMKKLVKTNVMRLLDAAKIAYEAKEYPVDENDLSREPCRGPHGRGPWERF